MQNFLFGNTTSATFFLTGVFWTSEVLIICLIFAPIYRFLRYGWLIRRQEFTNRLAKKKLSFYFDRFWQQTFVDDKVSATFTDDEKFSHVYDKIAGRIFYIIPVIILFVTTVLFGGLVISTAIRTGYERYIQNYMEDNAKEEELNKNGVAHLDVNSIPRVTHLDITSEDGIFLPFSYIVLSFSSLAAISGAYLYSVSVLMQGYRSRTLLSSDLLWCSFRLIISVPLGLSLAQVANSAIAAFVSFGLGAFPIDAINRILRRLLNRSLSVTEQEGDTDQLVKMLGVSANTAAELNNEGIDSVQQLADQDPVSLAIRTGLSFDYILNLVAQAQAWSFIGETAGKLAPLGFGDARSIEKLVKDIDNKIPGVTEVLEAAAISINVDLAILRNNFSRIAGDDYTKFLAQF